jgi:hypothetical protein
MGTNQAMVRPYQQEGFRGVAHRALVSGIRRGQTFSIGLAHENESHHACCTNGVLTPGACRSNT